VINQTLNISKYLGSFQQTTYINIWIGTKTRRREILFNPMNRITVTIMFSSSPVYVTPAIIAGRVIAAKRMSSSI